MVADKEALIVRQVRVGQTVDALVIIMLDHVVAGDAAAGDDAIADIGLFKSLHDFGPGQFRLGIEHEGKGECRALAVLTLRDEAIVAAEQLFEQRPVLPPRRGHAGQLL